MAYVAISNQLIHDVASKIDKLKQQERNAVKEPTHEVHVTPDDALATQLIWGEHMHLRDQIPDNWKMQVPKVTLYYRVQAEHDYNSAYYTLQATGTGFIVPRQANLSVYGMEIKFTEEADCPPIMAEVIEYTKQVTEIDSRWKKVTAQVKEFLYKCKSLNEALKLWPQLRIYIPQQYIDRMEKNSPAAKKSAEENAALQALQSIDTDFVVAAAVSARLASAAAGQT